MQGREGRDCTSLLDLPEVGKIDMCYFLMYNEYGLDKMCFILITGHMTYT